jgi:hypothetical protein
MVDIFTFEDVLWGATVFLNVILVVLLLYRKNHRVFPLFFIYNVVNLLQSAVTFESYRIWGFNSPVSFEIVWATQGLVIVARVMAVAEICWRVLAKYEGIWALGWRIFVAMATLVLAYSWSAGQHSWHLIALTADRGLELAIAAAILTLFMFIRYYEVTIERDTRFVAIGFFLYSCFRVLNDTVLERWLTHYAPQWNFLGTVAFLASLLLWSWALRRTQPKVTYEPEMLPADVYQTLAPEINSRLKTLNENLGQLWYARRNRT